jgi:glycosyltransferase involved in cell wall biosynthesis
MKLLHVFDLISPSRGGGMVTTIRNVTRTLARRGHEVTLYTSDFQTDDSHIKALPEVHVRAFHCISHAGNFFVTPDIVGEARREVKNFDLIHLHCLRSFQNIAVCYYARKYGIPYIIDAHGSVPRTTSSRWNLKWFLKWGFDVAFGYRILRESSKVIGETNLAYEEHLAMGVPKEKIRIVAPPLDTEEFSSLPPAGTFRNKYAVKPGSIVMFLGRIHWIKGIGFLTESFAELSKTRKDITLVIAGPDEGYRPDLERLIDRLGLRDRVIFTGFISGKDKLEALVDADVVVQTSIYEHGTVVPFEAVLCGTPIIVSRDTVASENVRNIDGGYLVEYGNVSELAGTLQYVLDNKDEARQKAQHAANWVRENMSLEKGIEKYEEVYAEVTGRS